MNKEDDLFEVIFSRRSELKLFVTSEREDNERKVKNQD
jgi:hypothetical protein